MQGLASPEVGERLIVSTGGGFDSVVDFAAGSMTVTDNVNGFAILAAADSTLKTNTDYKLYTGNGAPWVVGDVMDKVTFSADRLTVSVTGVYRLEVWADIVGFPTNTSTIAMKYRINGTTFSLRKTQDKSNSSGDSGSLNAFSIVNLSAGDYIQVMLASTDAGNITIGSMNLSATLLKAT